LRLLHHLALYEKSDDVNQHGNRANQPGEAPGSGTASFEVSVAEGLLIHAAFPHLP
jgi:hypothetical protein